MALLPCTTKTPLRFGSEVGVFRDLWILLFALCYSLLNIINCIL
jgi:hypothetical protein